jgi:hypothetical protein
LLLASSFFPFCFMSSFMSTISSILKQRNHGQRLC